MPGITPEGDRVRRARRRRSGAPRCCPTCSASPAGTRTRTPAAPLGSLQLRPVVDRPRLHQSGVHRDRHRQDVAGGRLAPGARRPTSTSAAAAPASVRSACASPAATRWPWPPTTACSPRCCRNRRCRSPLTKKQKHSIDISPADLDDRQAPLRGRRPRRCSACASRATGSCRAERFEFLRERARRRVRRGRARRCRRQPRRRDEAALGPHRAPHRRAGPADARRARPGARPLPHPPAHGRVGGYGSQVIASARPPGGDVGRILTGRAIRGFADGFVSVLLAQYLTALGFSPVAGRRDRHRHADRLGGAHARLRADRAPVRAAHAARRRDGADGRDRVGFASITWFWPLLVVAVVGTLNPSGG